MEVELAKGQINSVMESNEEDSEKPSPLSQEKEKAVDLDGFYAPKGPQVPQVKSAFDTKYEFGRDLTTGEILLIDEVHTPDSSRYWLAETYDECMKTTGKPQNIDKESVRLWFRDHCDPYKDETLPDAPTDMLAELSRRYIMLYEMITGQTFQFDAWCGDGKGNFDAAMQKAMKIQLA